LVSLPADARRTALRTLTLQFTPLIKAGRLDPKAFEALTAPPGQNTGTDAESSLVILLARENLAPQVPVEDTSPAFTKRET